MKHDGDIRIEIIEKGSNVYQTLPVQGTAVNPNLPPQTNPGEIPTAILLTSTPSIVAIHSNLPAQPNLQKIPSNFIVSQTQPLSSVNNIGNSSSGSLTSAQQAVAPNVNLPNADNSDIQKELTNAKISTQINNETVAGQEQQPSTMLINLLTQNNHKLKWYRCNLCPFETDDKSQFMYHSSFHTVQGEAFHCSFCSYSVTQKHLLTQHLRMHTGEASDNEIDTVNDTQPSAVGPSTGAIDLTTLPTNSTEAGYPKTGSVAIDPSKTISKQMVKIQELRHDNLVNQLRRHPIDGIWVNPPSSSSSTNASDANLMQLREEKCPHCPFSTTKIDILKDHLQCHISVSDHVNLANCDHCDFSIADESMLKEHTKIHFDLVKNRKNVAFYTSYDNLEITANEQFHDSNSTSNSNSNNNNNNNNFDTSTTTTTSSTSSSIAAAPIKTLFPINCGLQVNSSDKENKILIDINTGQVLK